MHTYKPRSIAVLGFVLTVLVMLCIIKFGFVSKCQITDLTIDPVNTTSQGTQVTIRATGSCGSGAKMIEVYANNRLLGRAMNGSIAVTWDTGNAILASAVTNYVSAYVYGNSGDSDWATKKISYPITQGIVRDPGALLSPSLVDRTCSLVSFNVSPPNGAIAGTHVYINAKTACLSDVTKMWILIGTAKTEVGSSNFGFVSTKWDSIEGTEPSAKETVIVVSVLEENGGFHEWKFPYALLGKP